MIESMLLVLSKALDGRDHEFNDWYTNIHLRDALRFRGVVATQRFQIAPEGGLQGSLDWAWRYLALYECYDAARFSQEHREAADTVRMEITEAFDGSVINDYYYYPLIWRANDLEVPGDGGVIVEFVNARAGADDELRAFYESYLPFASRHEAIHSAAFLAWRRHGQMLSDKPQHSHVAVYWTRDHQAAMAAWRADNRLARVEWVDAASLKVVGWNRLTRRYTREDVTHPAAADLVAEEQARTVLKRRKGGRSTLSVLAS